MTRNGRATFVIPDAAVWTMHGRDPLHEGYTPTVAPERAELFLVPEHLPADLGAAVADAWERMARPRAHVVFGDPVAGHPVAAMLDGAPASPDPDAGHDHGHDDPHGGHGDDHHDMMAIVGDPSADGLIMEPLDFALGPFAPSLPGGLVVEMSLDGDVVASAHPRAGAALGGAADPLAPLTWRVARARAASAPSEATARRQIVALEVERALSHALSFKSVASAMGLRELGDASRELSHVLLPLREAAVGALDAPADRIEAGSQVRVADRALAKVGRVLTRRSARRRLGRRGVVDRQAVEATSAGGPVARAAGLPNDARSADPVYAALDFTPATAHDGDAAARIDVRLAEAGASLRLVREAAAEAGGEGTIDSGDGAGLPVTVEGPRGPVVAVADPDGRVAVATPGAEATLELAGHAVVGLELGTAIVTLASFDLSPWRISG